MSDTLRKTFRNIFEKVQNSTSCHQKYLKMLMDLYKETSLEDFAKIFLNFLRIIVQQNTVSEYVKRSLIFCSRFCGDVTRMEEKNEEIHHLLNRVILVVLEWSSAHVYEMRHNSVRFITMVLQDIGEDVQLEIDLIEEIQKVMLQRVQETKVSLRLQAMSALVRLQDPQSPECPVISTYLRELSSGSVHIRREAVVHIAPNNMTIGKIKDRIRDVDPGVRSAAFHRCADIGPMSFKIADKHMILLCGFKELNENVKNTFYDYLLPKWLTAYKGHFLKFVAALMLIADEEDLNKMEYLTEELIKNFYQKHPITELLAVLPINDEKVVKVEDLTNEVTLFWKILTNLLRQSDNMDEYLNNILPELTPFCDYIERVIKIKSKEKMDEWKYFEYQFDLLNLFEVAENYDFSDEVGRRRMQSLTVAVLQQYSFSSKVTKKIVSIAHKCSSNIEFFTNDMCQLISEIREPLTEEPLTESQKIDRDFKIAEVRVKINILQEKQNEAVSVHDYQKAHLIEIELATLKKELEQKQTMFEQEKVRVVKSDNETLCRCLDILISMLELPAITKPTPSLLTCKDHFLVPLISNHGADLHWKILRYLSLFCIIDKAFAEEYAKIICIPMATYRTIPNNNVSALVQSICGVTDLIGIYGIEIVSHGEENVDDAATNSSVTKRKLYSNENGEGSILNTKHDDMTLSYIFEILLDMLDDERDEIRHRVIFAIGSLVQSSFKVTASLLSRLLLKWSNPLTEKLDPRLQVGLGLLLETYMKCKRSCEVVKEAIIPTLSVIANAPKTSPLSDIDSDNLLTFFAEIMNIKLTKDDIKILALDVCMKISENPNDRLIVLLTKFLSHLDIQQDNVESVRELIDRTEMLWENIKDRTAKKNVEKFLVKLKCHSATLSKTRSAEESNATNDSNNDEKEKKRNTLLRETTPENEQNKIKEPQQFKRRKQRNGQNCVVVLERFDEKSKNETTLHTIVESSMERMELDDDLIIETPTSESSNDSKTVSKRPNNVVVSETSDSDFSNDSATACRRSNRLRKKRIL